MTASPSLCLSSQQGLPPWHIDLLLGGAKLGGRAGALPEQLGLWLSAWAPQAATAVQACLRRPVHMVRSANATPASIAEAAVLALELSVDGVEGAFRLALDGAACRALAQPLLADLTSLRPRGDLSSVELGAVEFLVAELADSLASRASLAQLTCGPVGGGARRAARAWLQDRERIALPVTIAVGATRGHGLIDVSRSRPLRLPLEAMAGGPGASAGTEVAVRLEIGRLELVESEAASLEPGDALLLPLTELGAATSRFRLATDAGIAFAEARVRADEPLVCSVTAERIGLVLPNSPPAPGLARLRVTLGEARLDRAGLERLRAGDIVDLAKDDVDARIEVVSGLPAAPWCGRLVRSGAQLAVQVHHRVQEGAP